MLNVLGQSEYPRRLEALLGLGKSVRSEIFHPNVHGGAFISPSVTGLILLLLFLLLALAEF